MIKDLHEKEIINSENYLVNDANVMTTSTGSKYLSVILQDKTGTIEGKKWSIENYDLEVFTPGNIVDITGEVVKYKGVLQIKIVGGNITSNNQVDLENFIPQSKLSRMSIQTEINRIISTIKDHDYNLVVSSIYKDFEDKLFFFPAAVKNHHNYERGLMTHTLSMAQICEFLSSHYKNLNHDLLISGALLHDLGKIIEFNGPVLTKYTNEGKLLGHISIGFSIVREYCEKLSINKEKAMLLQHMILSHHGKYEFGSPVLPMVKEALVLSMVDDLDAKEELCEQTLVSVKKGEFSPRLFALEDRSIYNPNDD